MKKLFKILGPGLLFASTAIGTSHLVLSTRAGAHHGMIFLWIILFTLLLKYPFYEFAPRYTVATGKSLIYAYRKQGLWALGIFFFIITIEMFFVTGAIGAVSAGLLSITLGLSIPQWLIYGLVVLITTAILLIGKYQVLELIIKIISVLLLVTMGIIFVAVIIKGPIQPSVDFKADNLLEGTGLALLISMLGWMPNGMEGSTMHSVWILENERSDNEKTTLKNALLDFNIGYLMTALLAIMFLIIGAYASYGTGNTLDGNTMQFSTKLLSLFTNILGEWSFTVIAIAAFGTIYGTLITVWDAMARCFIRSLYAFKNDAEVSLEKRQSFFNVGYLIMIPVIGIGGALMFSFFTSGVILMLEFATIISFLLSPVIAYLNWKAIRSEEVGIEYRPAQWMHIVAAIGMIAMISFAIYYGYSIWLEH